MNTAALLSLPKRKERPIAPLSDLNPDQCDELKILLKSNTRARVVKLLNTPKPNGWGLSGVTEGKLRRFENRLFAETLREELGELAEHAEEILQPAEDSAPAPDFRKAALQLVEQLAFRTAFADNPSPSRLKLLFDIIHRERRVQLIEAKYHHDHPAPQKFDTNADYTRAVLSIFGVDDEQKERRIKQIEEEIAQQEALNDIENREFAEKVLEAKTRGVTIPLQDFYKPSKPKENHDDLTEEQWRALAPDGYVPSPSSEENPEDDPLSPSPDTAPNPPMPEWAIDLQLTPEELHLARLRAAHIYRKGSVDPEALAQAEVAARAARSRIILAEFWNKSLQAAFPSAPAEETTNPGAA